MCVYLGLRKYAFFSLFQEFPVISETSDLFRLRAFFRFGTFFRFWTSLSVFIILGTPGAILAPHAITDERAAHTSAPHFPFNVQISLVACPISATLRCTGAWASPGTEPAWRLGQLPKWRTALGGRGTKRATTCWGNCFNNDFWEMKPLVLKVRSKLISLC